MFSKIDGRITKHMKSLKHCVFCMALEMTVDKLQSLLRYFIYSERQIASFCQYGWKLHFIVATGYGVSISYQCKET